MWKVGPAYLNADGVPAPVLTTFGADPRPVGMPDGPLEILPIRGKSPARIGKTAPGALEVANLAGVWGARLTFIPVWKGRV